MKHLLLTTIAAVMLAGCGPSVDIHEAAEAGNIEAVKQHLDGGAHVNAKSESGWTPLHYAAWKGHTEVAELLIAKGADVNAKENFGVPALYHAAENGHKEIAEMLIAKGADVNTGSIDGAPLFAAVRRGHKEIAELLIAKGGDVNAKGVMIGWTPLHEAAFNGRKEIAELLIAKGANVNAKREKIMFLYMNDVQIAAGEDADAKENFGPTPLDFAIAENHPEIADLLRKHGGKTGEELPPATLFEAVNRVDLQGIKDLLAKGVDVNVKDMNGGTPLHGAAFNGRKEIAELLVAKGANVNAKNSFVGMAPLHYAAQQRHKETAELLIGNGADVNVLANDGTTPLDWAEKVEAWHSSEIKVAKKETADLLRKHGGKTGEELKAQGQ